MSLLEPIFNFLRFNKKNWKAVVLCLFAATVFWFFNALNKNYSANISFPLSFDYDQDKYIPVKALPTSLRVNVSGLGWDLFRKSSGLKVPPLIIPLERPSETRKIVGSTLPAHLAPQLDGIQINFVLADTLYIELDEKVKERFVLEIDSVRKYLHREFGLLGDIVITPDTLWIEGPRKIVNALPDTIQLRLPSRNIDRDFQEEIEITFRNDQQVRRDPPVAMISFEVEKLIEVNDRIKLDIINVPANLRSVIEVDEINCSYRLPQSLVKKLPEDSIRAVVDLRGVPPGTKKIVPVITGLPSYAHVVKVDTIRINF